MSKTKSIFTCAAMLVVVSALARGANKPTLSSMSPTSVVAGSASFTLTVNGSNFVSGSVVLWNNSSLTTTYVSGTRLTATVPGTTVSVAGTPQVAVYNPGRFGGTSNALTFTITPPTASTGSSSTTSALTITTTSVPNGTTGTAYSAALAASGGTTPYTWTVSGGALPAGIALSTSGAISGTPTTSGSFSFTAQVADSAAHTASYTYALSITSSPLAISTASLANGTAGTAYSATLAATGGTSPYTWTITSGGLPAGLSLASSGAISGTPTTAATYSFSVQVTDSSSGTSTKTLSMTVAAPAPPPPTTACSSPYGNCSDPYEGKGGPPATRTSISACGTYKPTAGQYMLVTQNLGTDPSLVCLTMDYSTATGWTLDLGGFTITGAIVVHSNVTGATVMNGTDTCSIPDSGNCLKVDYAIGVLASQFRIHHLTVNQTNNTSAQARCIFINAYQPTGAYAGGGSGNGRMVRIDHISITSRPSVAAGVYRSPLISVVGTTVGAIGGSLEIDHNYLYCQALTQQCHAVSLWALSNALVDSNLAIMDKNASNGGIGRFILWEGDTTPNSGLEIAYNDVTVNDQIAVRSWGSKNGSFPGLRIHDNTFRQITIGSRYGAISLGQNGVNLEDFVDAQIYNNAFEMIGGNGVDVIEATNVSIFSNTVTCGGQPCVPGYYLARTDVGDGVTPTGTSMKVSNNNTSALDAAGLPTVMVCQSPTPAGGATAYTCGYSATLSLGSSATVCNSGNAVGNGPITNAPAPCQ